MNGEVAPIRIKNTNKIIKGSPAKRTGIQPEANTIKAVPKSGCLYIRKLHKKIADRVISQSLRASFLWPRVK